MDNKTITGAGEPRMIDADELAFATWNPRPEITDADVAELAASIRDNGLLNRLSVCPNPNGKYTVFAGNRRLAACRLAGLKQIPCEVFDVTATEARTLTALENLQRKDVEPIREAALVEECLSAGMSGEEIAAKVGKSNAWVTRRRKLLALSDALREAVEKKPWAMTADALENIAMRPLAMKASEEFLLSRIGQLTPGQCIGWGDIAYTVTLSESELSTAPWIKDGSGCERCRACANRTGASPDLFGECEDGELGRCMDSNCFHKRRAEWEKRILDTFQQDGETVRVKYAWQLPSETCKPPEAGKVRCKKFPCAYIFFSDLEPDGYRVVFGASKAEAEAEQKKQAAEDEQRRKQNDEDWQACHRAGDAIAKWFETKGTRAVEKLCKKGTPRGVVEKIAALLYEWADGLYNAGDIAEAIALFPDCAEDAAPEDVEAVGRIAERADDE